jgi:RNA polymerase-binding transcription factor DksA
MSEPAEPHANVFRFGSCLACGAPDSWVVVAVPKLDTGEQFPVFGVCEQCGHQVDLKGLSPFVVESV